MWSFPGSASETTQTQPAKAEYGNREGDCAHVHSQLSMPGQARPEDINEPSCVVHKEGAQRRKQRPQSTQEDRSHNLFPCTVAGLLAIHRYHAVIDQDRVARIQLAVRPAIHVQGFAVNHHVGITARRKTVLIS
jgi:hypothetical protein